MINLDNMDIVDLLNARHDINAQLRKLAKKILPLVKKYPAIFSNGPLCSTTTNGSPNDCLNTVSSVEFSNNKQEVHISCYGVDDDEGSGYSSSFNLPINIIVGNMKTIEAYLKTNFPNI